ncbi:MAG TPA: ribonuclease Y [Acidobacteriota bacterium]|nr:ribonuclease Y [Acidobacteriota bacterium]
MEWIIVAAVLIIGAASIFGVYWVRSLTAKTILADAEKEAKRQIKEAELQAENIVRKGELESREKLLTITSDFERKTQSKRDELTAIERKLSNREEQIERRAGNLDKRESDLEARSAQVKKSQQRSEEREKELDSLVAQQQAELEKISGMTPQDAKRSLMKSMENEARNESAKVIRQIEEQARETGLTRARKIISMAIQRVGSEHVQETTVSVVDLPNDEMKGRIIGREGRNIRALEQATGIDLIIDDTPEAVILSGFDPYRREIARISIERLISDGRIHPGRIEEVVEKVRKEIDQQMREEGEATCFELGIHDLHPELVKLLGKLKYRSSYGQNVLQHSKEVSILAGMLAAELGANAQAAKRGGLLHDVGKAVDKETDGTHVQIGIKLLKKFGENKDVIHCLESHHFDTEPTTVEAILVQSADTLSAARPGARREILETYVKRLEKLEEIADSFQGVSKSYAIQAGREVRIIVESEKVNDDEAAWLAKDISKRIEGELEYPGEIRVTVIRETRSVEYAR